LVKKIIKKLETKTAKQAKPKKKKERKIVSSLEESFWEWLRVNGVADLFVREYETGHFYETEKRKIRKPTRVDFAGIDKKIAIEIEGGTWVFGRHSRGTGFTNDCNKYNWLTMRGWKVLRYTTDHDKKGEYPDLLQFLKYGEIKE